MPVRTKLQIGMLLFFSAVAVGAIVGVLDFPLQDRIFPFFASGLILISCAVYALGILKGAATADNTIAPEAGEGPFPLFGKEFRTVLPCATAVVSLIAGTILFGHLIAVPVFVLIYMRLHGERWVLAGSCALGMFLWIWLLLENFLHAALPDPLLLPFFPW